METCCVKMRLQPIVDSLRYQNHVDCDCVKCRKLSWNCVLFVWVQSKIFSIIQSKKHWVVEECILLDLIKFSKLDHRKVEPKWNIGWESFSINYYSLQIKFQKHWTWISLKGTHLGILSTGRRVKGKPARPTSDF